MCEALASIMEPENLSVDLVIEPMGFDASQTAVYTGSVPMSISGYSWTEDRAENYELSDYYYAGENETRQALLIKKENADKYTSPEDLAGQDVGAQNASLQMQLVTEQLTDANPISIGDITVGVMELKSGNIEALAVAYGNAEMIVDANPDLAICTWEFDVKAEDVRTAVVNAFNEAAAQDENVSNSAAEVKQFGGDSQMKITTTYKIDQESSEVDAEVENILYTALKGFFKADVSPKKAALSPPRPRARTLKSRSEARAPSRTAPGMASSANSSSSRPRSARRRRRRCSRICARSGSGRAKVPRRRLRGGLPGGEYLCGRLLDAACRRARARLRARGRGRAAFAGLREFRYV